MSAAEHQSPKESSQTKKQALSKPPQRPSLLQPPPRPAAPETSVVSEPAVMPAAPPPVATAAAETAQEEQAEAPVAQPLPGTHPIAPPSEPMQYRAIGLIRGIYKPSEEQLNRGEILADDGSIIEAVLLGRITSLIKKHLDLEVSHLWVVYPRTRQPNEEDEVEEATVSSLHAQIVGVWEPETLGMPGENPNREEEEELAATAEMAADEMAEEGEVAAPVPDAAAPATASAVPELPSDNYFSIRGEVLDYNEDANQILVKIVQGSKRSGKPPKAFRLHVHGNISGKTVGYFWELEVTRQGEQLMLTEGRPVGIVPPKKKKKGRPFSKGGGRRPSGHMGPKPSKPAPAKDKPRIRPPAPVKSNPL